MIRPPTSMIMMRSESTAMHRGEMWVAGAETTQHIDADQAVVADVK